ncbi:MAG: hypothetical protein FRX49_02467 [Trebouxia sp. A1-2]|nr:MAG: hypothetical protein FRX49_02467 [Trebouxia sp. A1-2]
MWMHSKLEAGSRRGGDNADEEEEVQKAQQASCTCRAAHAVVGGLERPITPVLQAVPNVDGDGSRDGVEGHPLGLLCLLATIVHVPCCFASTYLKPGHCFSEGHKPSIRGRSYPINNASLSAPAADTKADALRA